MLSPRAVSSYHASVLLAAPIELVIPKCSSCNKSYPQVQQLQQKLSPSAVAAIKVIPKCSSCNKNYLKVQLLQQKLSPSAVNATKGIPKCKKLLHLGITFVLWTASNWNSRLYKSMIHTISAYYTYPQYHGWIN